ncbi:MAG: dihydroorotase [Planctomycetota bacterium]
MSRWLLQGGRVVDPANGRDETLDLRIEAGHVTALGRLSVLPDETVIDARGLLVTPGLVDLCVHLREPGFEDIETIRSGAQAALAGGFTTIAAMPDTDPPVDSEATVAYIRLKGEAARAARVYPVGALTQGRQGERLSEMAGMARAGAVAFSDEAACVDRSVVFLRALRYARMVGKPVLTRCEDAGLRGQGVASPGLIADMMALPAIAPGTEEIMVGRNLYLARQEQGPLHLLHLSTAESLRQLVAARERGVQVSCSVTPHHLLFTEASIEGYPAIYKFRPPLRAEPDRDALVAGLREGTVDAISSQHAPRGMGEKNLEFVFAAADCGGLETTFAVLYTKLVETGALSAQRLVAALSTAPARILGTTGGTLAVGAVADVSCFDVTTPWTIDPSQFCSRSHLSPYAGWTVLGRARHVWVGGEARFLDGQLHR